MNKRKEKLRKIDLPKHMRYKTARGWVFRGENNADEFDFARKYERTHPRWQRHQKIVKQKIRYWHKNEAYKKEDLHKKKLRVMDGKHAYDGYSKRIDSYRIYRFDDDWARQAKMYNKILEEHVKDIKTRYEEIDRVKWVNNNRGIKSKSNEKVRWRKILKLSNEAVRRDVSNGVYFDDNLYYSAY